jgi:hypothetical protein
MEHLNSSRRERSDLLSRPPCNADGQEFGWPAVVVDPVAQLSELAALRTRGLLTEEQYESQKAKVLGF